MIREICNDPNDYIEARDTGSEPAVEHLIQLRLRSTEVNGDSLFTSPEQYEQVLELAKKIQLLQLFELLDDPLEASREAQSAEPFTPTASHMAREAIASRIFIRNPSYSHFGWEIIHLLFDKFASQLQTTLGFTVSDIEIFVESMEACMTSNLGRFREQIRTWSGIDSESRVTSSAHSNSAYHEDGSGFVTVAGSEPIQLRRPFIFSFDELLQASSLGQSTLRSLLEYFCTSPGEVPIDYRLLRHNGPMHRRPVIDLGKDFYVLPCPYLFPWCIQEALEFELERAAKDSKPLSKVFSKYLKHRAKCIEQSTLDLILQLMPGAKAYQSVEYDVLRDGQQVRCELDVLILWDCHALIIEVKSGGLGSSGFDTSAKRLGQKFNKIYGSAQSQIDRAMDHYLGTLNPVFVYKGVEFTVDRNVYTSVIPISVSLEGFQSLTSSFAAMVSSSVLSPKYVSWLVQYHDLRIICEVCQQGAVLIAYIRERLLMAENVVVRGRDEVSLLGWFLSRGLRSFHGLESRYNLVSPESATQEIDNYYLHQMGLRTIETALPSIQGPEVFLEVLGELLGRQVHGWTWIASRFLSLAGEDRERFASLLSEFRSQTLEDGRSHDFSLVLEDGGVTVVTMVASNLDRELERLQAFCRAKRYQSKRTWWMLIISLADRQHYVAEATYIAGTIDQDIEVVRLATQLPSSKLGMSPPLVICQDQGLDYPSVS